MGSLHEPFMDHEAITQEMADDMAKSKREYDQACNALQQDTTPVNAAECLKTFEEMTDVYESVNAFIYTVPVLVHIADERREEDNPDDLTQQGCIQRCARCGTVLHFWHEGLAGIVGLGNSAEILEIHDIPWWNAGDLVAKHQHGINIGMYEIEKGRPLEKHEQECVSLAGLEDITKGSNND